LVVFDWHGGVRYVDVEVLIRIVEEQVRAEDVLAIPRCAATISEGTREGGQEVSEILHDGFWAGGLHNVVQNVVQLNLLLLLLFVLRQTVTYLLVSRIPVPAVVFVDVIELSDCVFMAYAQLGGSVLDLLKFTCLQRR